MGKGRGGPAENTVPMSSFKVFARASSQNYFGIFLLRWLRLILLVLSLTFLQISAKMHHTTKRICPGCGRYFLPGGYANHLRLTGDPCCKSVCDSFFQTPLYHSGFTTTLGPSHTSPSATLGPSHISESLDPDIEMMDVGSENDDLLPMDPDTDPLLPSQPIRANNDSTDQQDSLDELLSVHPHCPTSTPLIIDRKSVV